MSKFFITNNKSWYQQTKERISESDYSLAFDYVNDGVFALTTHKLKIHNTNAYEDANGAFVIATGTAIYKESLDYTNALADFKREDTSGGGVISLRKNTIGQYAYVIKQKSNVIIFGDGFGAYNIYYYIDKEGYYLVSNSLYDMAKVLSRHITLNEMNLIEQSIRFSILCNETFFNEINRLGGDEYVEIQSGKISVNSLPEKWEMLDGDVQAHAKELSQLLRKKASIIANVLGEPGICMTGGLDSRMSLAAYMSAGVKPVLYWGGSNTTIASPEPMDKEIVHTFSTKFGLKERIMSWDTTRPDVEWEKYLNRYGFLFNLWGAAPDIMTSFENMDERLCTCGYGGELFRNLHLTENRKNDISIDELMQEYYIRSGRVESIDEENYVQHIKNKLLKVARKYQLDPMHMRPEDITYFYIEYRSVADTKTVNLLNCIGYSNMLLMEKDIVQYCRVPNSDMDKSRYMLEVMHNLYPEILSVPVFSHQTICRYDPRTMVLYSGIDAKRSNGVLIMKAIYKKSKGLLKPLRNLFKRMEHVDKSKPYFESHQVNYQKPSDSLNTNLEFLDCNNDIDYVMNIYALNTILRK